MIQSKITDRDYLNYGAQQYEDVFSPQQARIWVGSFRLGWSNKVIAEALKIKESAVRSALYEIRKIVKDNPDIAYRSINLKGR